jgi:hypothetical protein
VDDHQSIVAGVDAMPEISEPLLEAAGHALDPADLPLLGMLIHRTRRPKSRPPCAWSVRSATSGSPGCSTAVGSR